MHLLEKPRFRVCFSPRGWWKPVFFSFCLALAFFGADAHNRGTAATSGPEASAAPREDYHAGTGDAAGLWTETWTTPSGDRHTVVEPPAPQADAAPQPLLLEPRIYPVVPYDEPQHDRQHFRPDSRHGRRGY